MRQCTPAALAMSSQPRRSGCAKRRRGGSPRATLARVQAVIDAFPWGVSALALVAACVAVAAFVQATAGVGFALIIAPVVGLVAPTLLPVALLVLMLPLNAYVAY